MPIDIQEPSNITVVQGPPTRITIAGQGAVNVNQNPETVVIAAASTPQIITIGTQGPPGPPGTGSVISGICGANIIVGTCVILLDGLIYPADPTNSVHAPLYVGVATESKSTTQTVTIAQLGSITLSGLSETRYYLGLSGVLSINPVAAGAAWLRYIGTAQSNTDLVLVSSVSVLLD